MLWSGDPCDHWPQSRSTGLWTCPPPVPPQSDLQVNSQRSEPTVNGVPVSLQGNTSLRLTSPAMCGGRHASRLLLRVPTPQAQVSPWCSMPSWAARTGPRHGRSAAGLEQGACRTPDHPPVKVLGDQRPPGRPRTVGKVVIEVPGTDRQTRVCLNPSFAGGLLRGLSKLLVMVIRESRNRVPHRRTEGTLANSGDGGGRPGRGQRSFAHTAALGLFFPLLRETWKYRVFPPLPDATSCGGIVRTHFWGWSPAPGSGWWVPCRRVAGCPHVL